MALFILEETSVAVLTFAKHQVIIKSKWTFLENLVDINWTEFSPDIDWSQLFRL